MVCTALVALEGGLVRFPHSCGFACDEQGLGWPRDYCNLPMESQAIFRRD